MDVILASQSPRRRELLALLQIPFDVEVSGEKEIIPEDACPEQIVMALAEQKAQHVFLRHPNHCVIGADTIVVLDGHILGKPKIAAQAVEYLSALQGKNHYVLTGVCVKTPHGSLTRYESTLVRFRPMTIDEITWYVSTGDPMDKAGAYGVQGLACCFVDSVDGNFFNVVGLPLPLLYSMLLELRVMDTAHMLL
ncbi:MAG: Maf family protein [Eubacteriales bacterium]|jgi:septum formation protein|nr:Maf family protein [Eubacteriales bacterium]MDY2983534.1 Maf family protein [Eubacteriales bacterium]